MRALAALLLVACSKATPAPAPDAAAPAVPVVDAAAPDASTVTTAIDPLAAVLDGKAAALPEQATDPGKTFDPALRDKVAAPRSGPVKQGVVTVDHGLPPEVVKRIVRQNVGRFRLCWQKATVGAPELAGHLAIAFTIDSAGDPKEITRSPGGIESNALAACVVHAFEGLSFPAPEGGPSHVVYGLEFGPDL